MADRKSGGTLINEEEISCSFGISYDVIFHWGNGSNLLGGKDSGIEKV